MSFERTVTAKIPRVATGRRYLAAELQEAPDVDGVPGAWKPVEAVAIPNAGDVVPDTISTRYAEHDPGWYRLHWYDDGQNSKYSAPVKIGNAAPSGRWN